MLAHNIFQFDLNSFRYHKETIKKFKNTLADSSKARRHRRLKLNIHITILAWITECFGFLVLFIGKFILGHDNNIINLSMQTLTYVIYFNILPCVLLVNDSDFKGQVAESRWYNTLLSLFNCQYIREDKDDGEDELK